MRRKAPAAVLCALLACALAVVPSAGSAVSTSVSIGVGFKPEVGNPFFQGKIHSRSRGCRVGRLVSVYRVRNQRVFRFGSARTGPRGHYKIPMTDTMKTAGYFARAPATGACGFDRSREIAVGQRGRGGNGPGGTE